VLGVLHAPFMSAQSASDVTTGVLHVSTECISCRSACMSAQSASPAGVLACQHRVHLLQECLQ
jgi:hypothetical protein